MQSLAGKNYLVVGGTGGIGSALVRQLQSRGAHVISASRRAEGPGDQHLVLDVTGDVTEALAALPPVLHGVAYAVGSINLKPVSRLSIDDFEADMQLNLYGLVRVIQGSLKALRAAEGASIVTFSSVAAQAGMAFHASIASAKAAVEGLTRSLAAELAPVNIRVNGIAPSLTDTPLAGNLLNSEDKRAAGGKRHPLGRVGQPDDLAAAAAYLLSPDSSWVTGQILGVDGGLSHLR